MPFRWFKMGNKSYALDIDSGKLFEIHSSGDMLEIAYPDNVSEILARSSETKEKTARVLSAIEANS